MQPGHPGVDLLFLLTPGAQLVLRLLLYNLLIVLLGLVLHAQILENHISLLGQNCALHLLFFVLQPVVQLLSAKAVLIKPALEFVIAENQVAAALVLWPLGSPARLRPRRRARLAVPDFLTARACRYFLRSTKLVHFLPASCFWAPFIQVTRIFTQSAGGQASAYGVADLRVASGGLRTAVDKALGQLLVYLADIGVNHDLPHIILEKLELADLRQLMLLFDDETKRRLQLNIVVGVE